MKFNRDDLVYSDVIWDFGTIVGYNGSGVYVVAKLESEETHEVHESKLKRARRKPVKNLGDCDLHRKRRYYS